jgi:hypothetical protein
VGVRSVWDDDEKMIARLIIEAPWKMDDIYHATDALKAEMKAANIMHPIGIILDATTIDALPTGIMQSTGPMIKAMQPEAVVIVVASPSRFLSAMHSIFNKLYTKYADIFKFSLTLDEARTRITQRLKNSVPE